MYNRCTETSKERLLMSGLRRRSGKNGRRKAKEVSS